MSKKLNAVKAQGLEMNTHVLMQTEADAKEWSLKESGADDIGFHRDIGFLIQLGLCDLNNVPKTREELNKLLEGVFSVITRLKRGAAFKLGDITLLANRYGVITFVSSNDVFAGFGSLHTTRCSQILHSLLGSQPDGYAGSDRLYNYQVRAMK